MTVAPPDPADLADLPEALTTLVLAQHGDVNGHMNVRHHLAMHDDAGWLYFNGLGFDEPFIKSEQRNFFDIEHHLRYYGEVMVGDALSVHLRLLDRGAKIVHYMSYMLNNTRNELSSTLEVTTTHVDLRTRRSIALRSPDSDELDARLERDRKLPWTAPVCEAMGVRRS